MAGITSVRLTSTCSLATHFLVHNLKSPCVEQSTLRGRGKARSRCRSRRRSRSPKNGPSTARSWSSKRVRIRPLRSAALSCHPDPRRPCT